MNHDFLFRALLAATVCGALAGCVSSGSSGRTADPGTTAGKIIEGYEKELRDLEREISKAKADGNEAERRKLEEIRDQVRKELKEYKEARLEDIKKKVRGCYVAEGPKGGASSAFDALLQEVRPRAPQPDSNLLLKWGGGSGGSSGGDRGKDC